MTIHVDAIFRNGVFQPLGSVALTDGQAVSLDIVVPETVAPMHITELPDWCNVYDGLTDEQIAEVEKIALDRSNFMRPPEVD